MPFRKLLKLSPFLMLSVSILINVSTHASNLVSSSAQTAAEGGTSGGGGNLIPLKPKTSLDVEISIGDLKAVLPLVFNAWEANSAYWASGGSGDSGEYSELQYTAAEISRVTKLFFPGTNGSKNVFDILPELVFKTKASGACLDLDGKASDASAFHVDQHEICMSVERLAVKLGENRISIPLVGLAVHEIAHKLGANEAEALLVQRFLQHWIGLEQFERAKELSNTLSTNVFALINALTSLIDNVDDKKSTEMICAKATALEPVLMPTLLAINGSRRSWVSPLRKHDLDLIFSIAFRASNIVIACPPEQHAEEGGMMPQMQSDPSYELRNYRSLFGGRDVIPLHEFMKRQVHDQWSERGSDLCMVSRLWLEDASSADHCPFTQIDNRYVHNIANGDLGNLQAELTDIRDLARRALKVINSK